MRIGMVLAALSLVGCNYLDGSSAGLSQPQELPQMPLSAPPGASEDTQNDTYARLISRGNALEAARRPIEALRLYREALASAPSDLSPENREALTTRITRLSFLLGVPDGTVDISSNLRAAQVTPANSAAVARCKILYDQAMEAERQGRQPAARALYREILGLIHESDDGALYWNAWQRLEDLSPEGEGPAAQQQAMDDRELEQEDGEGQTLEQEDGVLLPGAPEVASDGRAADQSLSRARAAYVKGMDYAKAKDKVLARQSFQEVLTLIRESQDPELFRAARQNLIDLDQKSRK